MISMTNSIFLNQIGYFGALILLVFRWILNKENRFERTGLEIPFILFLTIELVSAIFSINQVQALTNFSKRLLLIPVVYVMVAVTDDVAKAKLFFKFFIGAALLTITVYIIFAYDHFISQLYRIEAKGPSPFQYVMTAGGLMSFTVIILFAFLINEKGNIKNRLFYLLAFGISSAALMASYTRAAWIGAAAGIILILFLKRKWLVLALGFLLFVAVLFTSSSESKIFIFNYDGNKIENLTEFDTEGRAYSLLAENDQLYVADYENGAIIRENENETRNIKTEAPAVGINRWDPEHLIVFLVDTRILLLHNSSNNNYEIINEFTSPGRTFDYRIRNYNLYTADVDSGLTIFFNPLDLTNKTTLKEFIGIHNFDIDSNYFAYFDPIKNGLFIYDLVNGIPHQKIDSVNTKSGYGYVWIFDNEIYFQNERDFAKYTITDNKLIKTLIENVSSIFRLLNDDGKLFALSIDGKIYEIEKQTLSSKLLIALGINPTDFDKEGNDFFVSFNKRSRLSSIIDPYHITNIERINQWKTGLKILKDYPLIGVGDIDLGKVYSEYKDYYLKENFGHLHNNYIHFLVILGVIGFIILIFMFVKIFLEHYKNYMQTKEIPFVSSFTLGAMASYVGFLISGLAEWNFGDQEIITMVWFTLGLSIAFYRTSAKQIKKD